ncbi:hypothetical protein FVE85_7699 [Porphyridium purpureum]|uniref:Uncharacterized protein n=1 Tax=Porphyridium purpureum TaxID=35688 RepID=A0A5J4YJ64_PORPP|nr:hypothetical protein FVE85_7699 [Porphyridium purpureum]|eukprot:POR4167..scf210_14
MLRAACPRRGAVPALVRRRPSDNDARGIERLRPCVGLDRTRRRVSPWSRSAQNEHDEHVLDQAFSVAVHCAELRHEPDRLCARLLNLPGSNLRAYLTIQMGPETCKGMTHTHMVAAIVGDVQVGQSVLSAASPAAWSESEGKPMEQRKAIRVLHEVAVSKGAATYIDPATGYTVFTALSLLQRPTGCCGISAEDAPLGAAPKRTHRCRHCPYDHDGRLNRADMKALAARAHLLVALRDRVDRYVDTALKDKLAEASVRHEGRECQLCFGSQEADCERCKGVGILISPDLATCHVCRGAKRTPCPRCTAWAAPVPKAFGE